MEKDGRNRKPESLKVEALRLYQEGMSGQEVAAAIGCSSSTVYLWARESGITRGRSESLIIAKAKDVRQISPERWRELYCFPGSGYPSMGELARRFGVDHSTIRACLESAGIKIRTLSEQVKVEYRLGRKKATEAFVFNKLGKPATEAFKKSLSDKFKGRPLSAETKRKLSESKRSRIQVECSWCGTALERTGWELKTYARSCCNHSCVVGISTHLNRKGADAPRPVIVAKLLELNRGWPNTRERLEKVGQQIGAREPEILKVLLQEIP